MIIPKSVEVGHIYNWVSPFSGKRRKIKIVDTTKSIYIFRARKLSSNDDGSDDFLVYAIELEDLE